MSTHQNKSKSEGASSLLDLFSVPSENEGRLLPHPVNASPDPTNARVKGGTENQSSSVSGTAVERNNEHNAERVSRLFSPSHGGDGNGDSEIADVNAPSGSTAHMMGLFAKPGSTEQNLSLSSKAQDLHADSQEETLYKSPSKGTGTQEEALSSLSSSSRTPLSSLFSSDLPKPVFERQSTAKRSNFRPSSKENEQTPLLATHYRDNSWGRYPTSSTEITPKTNTARKTFDRAKHSRLPSIALPKITESRGISAEKIVVKINGYLKVVTHEMTKPTTYIGSFMFLLYHVVFCLTMGSAIIRPGSSQSILGLMTKTASLGIIFGAGVYWVKLGTEIPAMYPTSDLFLAPFLANLAVVVDTTLQGDPKIRETDNDVIFLATFSVLSGIGIFTSASLLWLASMFKLANLGSFLPFPVICGFFSAVGILTWTLAVAVDTNGQSIGSIVLDGNVDVLKHAFFHHLPSVVVAAIMKHLGPKNPFYVVLLVFATIGMFYLCMFVGGISLEEAQQMGWFWSREELVHKFNSANVSAVPVARINCGRKMEPKFERNLI